MSESLSSDSGSLEPNYRSVCRQVERPAPSLRKLASSTRRLEDRRAVVQLERHVGVRIPPVRLNTALPEQDIEGSGRGNRSMSLLAEPGLVPAIVRNGMRHAVGTRAQPGHTVVPTGRAAPIDPERILAPNRLEIIRQSYDLHRFPDEVVELLVSGTRAA